MPSSIIASLDAIARCIAIGPCARESVGSSIASGAGIRQGEEIKRQALKAGHEIAWPPIGTDRPQSGKPSSGRDDLKLAAELSHKHKAAPLWRDMNRLIRSEAYHRYKNQHAVQTADEIAWVLESFDWWHPPVICLPLNLTPSQIRGKSISRGKRLSANKQGRRASYEDEQLQDLIIAHVREGLSAAKIAELANEKQYSIDRYAVRRFLKTPEAIAALATEPVMAEPELIDYRTGLEIRRAIIHGGWTYKDAEVYGFDQQAIEAYISRHRDDPL